MGKKKSKEQMGIFEQLFMSIPAPDRSLVIDKIFRSAARDKRSLAEKLRAEELFIETLRIEKLRTEKPSTRKPVTRKRRAV